MKYRQSGFTRRGLTLFELMIVAAIILIVASLASPLVFEGMDGQTKVNAAADLVRAQWATCRAQAIEDARPYRFAVIPNTGKFKIEPFSGTLDNSDMLNFDTSTTNQVMGNQTDTGSGSAGFVLEDVLPKPVRFGTKEVPVDPSAMEADGGEYVTVAVFLPNGTASDDATIMFGAKGAALITLQLRGITGAASTIKGNPGGHNP